VRKMGESVVSKYTPIVALLAAALGAPPIAAHHSRTIYDADTELTLRGTVTRYEWKNPHVYIYIDVEDATGATSQWELEGGATPLMMRSGWTRTSLAPGDVVVARINPNSNANVHNGWLLTMSADNGTSLTRWVDDTKTIVPATGIAGVWDALIGFQNMQFNRGALTERAAVAEANYDETQNPVKDCIAAPVPVLTYMPYRSEIEVLDDRVMIRTEYFDVERTIYTDGRGHPEGATPTNQGHSIGHWDGDALVVDTVAFTDSPIGSGANVPSGAQKHLVERFEISDNRTQLEVSFSIEDPEYLLEPSTGELFWDYVPDGEMHTYECDPEVARRYVIR